MQSIKKLEEQWVMNQRKHGSERTTFGLKDDNFDKTLNGVVIIFWNYISCQRVWFVMDKPWHSLLSLSLSFSLCYRIC